MELELKNGDYVPDGIGGVHRVSGREALAQRVLFRRSWAAVSISWAVSPPPSDLPLRCSMLPRPWPRSL